MVPHWGQLCPPPPSPRGDCVDTFIAITKEALLTPSGWRPGMLVTALHCPGRPAQQRMTKPKISVVLRSRNPDVDSYTSQYYTQIDASISRFLNLSRNG